MEIKNKETKRQKAVLGGGKRYRNHLQWAQPPSGMFIIAIYSNIILIPLL
jgi:hypothetical protein